jgi:colicin import membrane protein
MARGRRQKNNMAATARENVMNGMDRETRLVSIAFTASAVCHILFLSILIFTQTHEFRRRPVESFISVNLVSLPKTAPPAQPTQPAKKPPTKAKTEVPPQTKKVSTKSKQQTADVSLAPKKKISLKKKTFKTEKVKKSALEKLEKKVETTSTERIAEAIERIKSRVEKEDTKVSPRTGADASPQTRSVLGDEKDTGGKRAELIDFYRVEIAFQIQKNWAFADQLAGGSMDLHTWLIFKVMPDGEIKDLIFTDRSGNKHFDESAYRAVIKSNPVDPHPKGVSEPFVEMGLHFTPEGIQ